MADPGFQMGFDAAQKRDLKRSIERTPKEMRRKIPGLWRKKGNEAIRKMRKSHFSRSGPHSIGVLPNKKRRWSIVHVRSSLGIKKLKFRKKGTIGGYMVLGYRGEEREKNKIHFIGRFHELGTNPRYRGGGNRTQSMKLRISEGQARGSTGRLPARAPLYHAWQAQKEGFNIWMVTKQALDHSINEAWKSSMKAHTKALDVDW